MKKLVVIMLMLMYVFSSTGMMINLHYCCGKLDRIDFSSSRQNSSDHKMGMKPCCETKQVSNKEKSDQESYTSTVKTFKSFSEINQPLSEIKTFELKRTCESLAAHRSPIYSTPPVFILTCDFRI